jgi:hypothetical protein
MTDKQREKVKKVLVSLYENGWYDGQNEEQPISPKGDYLYKPALAQIEQILEEEK